MSARVGLMLYTVRRSAAEDFRGTLEAVARIGYEGVELHDLHGHEATVVRGWLDDLHLAVCSLHATLAQVEAGIDELAGTARALGTDRLVVSWVEPPATRAEALAIRDRLAAVVAGARELGLAPGFHNHDAEARPLDGERPLLDELLATVPGLFLELDLGWIWWAGEDPAAVLERAAGRAPLVHVKDFRSRGERSFCPVGDGAVGYDTLLPGIAGGVEWLLVEQDEVEQGTELEAAERSLAAVRRSLGPL